MPTGVTYRLSFKDSEHWAIGSTTQPLNKRKRDYWKSARNNSIKTLLYEKIREVGKDSFQLTEVDWFSFTDIKTLRKAEQELLDDHMDDMCLNTYKAFEGRDPQTVMRERNNRRRAEKKNWELRNHDVIKKRKQAYHVQNREAIKEKAVKYYEKHREVLLTKQREYRAKNRDAINEKQRERRCQVS